MQTTAAWSAVCWSEIPSDLRFEPEYHQPQYLELERTLAEIGCDRLEDLTITVNSGPFGSNLLKELYQEDGVIVLRPFNIKNATFGDDDLVYISEATLKAQGLPLYKPGDVAFARVGDIRCGVIPDFGKPITISPNIIIARLNKQKATPYFVVAFMNTTMGASQLARAMKVVAQPTITVETVKSLAIPRIPLNKQAKIEKMLKASFEKRDESQTLYAQAEALLLAELGLQDLMGQDSSNLTYTQSFSRATAAGRWDAEYFQPKYEHIETAIQNAGFPVNCLDDLIEPITNGVDSRTFVCSGTPYIRVGDVKRGRIDIVGAVKVPLTIKDIGKDISLRPGDVLFTRKGTFGNVAVVRDGQEHIIISSEIMLLRLRDARIQPDYLALFLNSVAGYKQVERRVHGVAFYSISQPDLASIYVPVLLPDIQTHLTKLVRESIEAEVKAHQLLEEAKQRVEEMVLG